MSARDGYPLSPPRLVDVDGHGDPVGLSNAQFKKEWQDKATRMLGGVDGYKLTDVEHVNW